MNSHLISQYFLFWVRPEFLFLFLILGYLFIDQKIFRRTIILLLFTSVLGAVLKCIWKVPLAPQLAKNWWAYPSGHTQFSVVMWLTLLYQLPRKWLLIKKWVVLPAGLYFMVDAGYHDWPEVFGGICSGIIISCCYIFWLLQENKNELAYRVSMFSIAAGMYAILTLTYNSVDFSWMAKIIGLMIVACAVNNKTDMFIKHLTIPRKALLAGITSLFGVLLAIYVKPTEFQHVIKFMHGVLLGVTFFYALPKLIGSSRFKSN